MRGNTFLTDITQYLIKNDIILPNNESQRQLNKEARWAAFWQLAKGERPEGIKANVHARYGTWDPLSYGHTPEWNEIDNLHKTNHCMSHSVEHYSINALRALGSAAERVYNLINGLQTEEFS